jgi:hypothetical protein
MRHPFELELSDLEAVEFNVVEDLTDEEAANIGGGRRLTTQALGEEGGEVTTLAVGEEGGEVTTFAVGEEGGFNPGPKPPIATTLALGEEGGSYWE